MTNQSKNIQVSVWAPDRVDQTDRVIATEVPVALEYNCVSHAVMMISPLDLEDFVRGFSLTEGIIDQPDNIIDLKIDHEKNGYVAAIEIKPDKFDRLEDFKRTLAGRTGCGLCGIDRLEHVIRPLTPIKANEKIPAEKIHAAFQDLNRHQPLNEATGAVHAAAFMDQAGQIIAVREDVGRHNALDKLIGHLMSQDIDPASGMALITSRASFEMIHKSVVFGFPALAAISAPTDLAISLATENNLALIALARPDNMSLYCDPLDTIKL